MQDYASLFEPPRHLILRHQLLNGRDRNGDPREAEGGHQEPAVGVHEHEGHQKPHAHQSPPDADASPLARCMHDACMGGGLASGDYGGIIFSSIQCIKKTKDVNCYPDVVTTSGYHLQKKITIF